MDLKRQPIYVGERNTARGSNSPKNDSGPKMMGNIGAIKDPVLRELQIDVDDLDIDNVIDKNQKP